jgi:hypothetical protein
MATKKILFQVEIEGSEQIIRTQKQLAEAIKATNEQLKQTELGTEEYRKLEAELGKLKNAQKDVADSQKAVQRELEVQASGGARTYRALNAELVNLRSLYKELTEVERNSQIGVEMRKQIQLLDAELKDIDASIGQFQRNVGNYSQAFEPLKGLLSSSVPGFSQLAGAADAARTGIGQVGQAATLSGKAITSMFVGFQAISLILEGVQAIREFAAETNKLRGEIQRLGNETTEQAAAATSKIIALGNTFKADQEELLKATNAVAQNFGISYEEALKKIETGYLAGADANGKFLDALTEFAPKAKGAGASADQLFVSLTQAGQAGLEEEEVLEKIIQKSDQLTTSLESLVDQNDELTKKQSEQLKVEEEIAANKVALSENITKLFGTQSGFLSYLQNTGLKILNSWLGFVQKVFGAYNGLYEAGKLLLGGEFSITKLTEAFNKGVADSLASGEKALEQQKEAAENQALLEAQRLAAEAKQEELDRKAGERLKAGEAAKKAQEAQAKLNEEAIKAQETYGEQRIQLLNELTKKLADVTIEGIQNETAKEIAEEQQRFELVKAELAKQETELVKAQEEARQAIIEAKGKTSDEVKVFDRQADADVEAQRKQTNAILEQEEQQHQLRLQQIRNDARKQEATDRLQAISANIKAVQEGYKQQATAAAIELNQAITEALQSGEDAGTLTVQIKAEYDKAAAQRAIQEAEQQIATIQAALTRLAEDDTITNASIEEYQLLTSQLDAYQLARTEAEKQYTQIVTTEEKKREDERKKGLEFALETLGTVASVFDQFQAAASQREQNALDERAQQQAERIENIEKQLETASGAQKKRLEAQLKSEIAAAERLDKEKEQLEKEEARRAKAFAIVQAIINTALAVTRALATSGPVGAVLAAALGAAQIATITAQPAAEGGLMGADVPQMKDGLVVTKQNIPTMRNGDNVLATVKRGEVVLNKRQQAALGGPATFRKIGVPGFADGGLVGGAPRIADVTSETLTKLEQGQALLAQYIQATNQRIDRIQTYVVTEDIVTEVNTGNRVRTAAIL